MTFPEHLVIDINKLRGRKLIGVGGFGKVYSVNHKDWGLALAVKKLGVTNIDEKRRITTKIKREACFLYALRHVNIIEFVGVLWKEPDFGIVMRLAAHGALDHFIDYYPTGPLVKIDFTGQICVGLAYLHTLAHPVIHGDIKISNVLVDTGCVMKLADFGLSSWRDYQRTYSKTTTAHGVQGTITHIAPEKWENPAIKPRQPQDMYALGILIWELFSEKPVFEGNSRDLIIQYIRDGKRPSVDDMGAGVPSKLKELVRSCWAQEESQRPTVIEIKSSLEGIVTNIEEDITRAKSKLLSAIKESSDEENDELREEPVSEDVDEHSSNPHSEVACSAEPKVTEKMHPKFTMKPKEKDVKEGDKAEFHATAKGKPIPEITWFKGDKLIKSTDRVTITSKEVHGDQKSTLTIHKAKMTDSCELRACARNTAGEDNCTAKLSLREEPVPEDVGEHSSNPHSEVASSAELKVTEKMHPKFTVKPKDKDVKEGDKADFHATAKGKPIPEITWFKGDKLITPTDRLTITSKKVHGDRTSTLTIHKADITDSCELRVCATNTAGEDNCTAKLRAASRFGTVSYRARDSGTVLHLCEVEVSSVQAYTDKVSAIRPAAVVWPTSWGTPSVPGVEVLGVRYGGEARVRGLQDAESRGHKTVAVVPGRLGDIKPLYDHAAARHDPAATDVWLLCPVTDWLSDWQREMDEDSRYSRIK